MICSQITGVDFLVDRDFGSDLESLRKSERESVWQLERPDEEVDWRGFFIGPFENDRHRFPARFHSHRHPYYEIFFLEKGAGYFWNDFERYQLQKYQLFFASPGQVHFWDQLEQCSGFVIAFQREFLFLEAWAGELTARYQFFTPGLGRSAVAVGCERLEIYHQWCDRLITEYSSHRSGRDDMLRALLVILLTEASRDYQAPPTSPSLRRGNVILARFYDLVEELYRTTSRIANYASRLGISANHLSDVVRGETGVTVGAVVQNRLLLEAKRLLLHSDLTVAEIAYALNFRDPSYFGRFFKRLTESAPGDFRDLMRQRKDLQTGASAGIPDQKKRPARVIN